MDKIIKLEKLTPMVKQISNGVTAKVIAVICAAFGVNSLQDVVIKTTSNGNDVPAQVSREVDAFLKVPGNAVAVVNAITYNPEAIALLQQKLYEIERAQKDERDSRRMDNITRTLLAFYSNRSGDEVNAADVESIATVMDKEHAFQGKRGSAQYDDLAATWIPARESRMAEVIAGLCKARTSKSLMEGYARLLVQQGVDPADTEQIRTRLMNEEDIASSLKVR